MEIARGSTSAEIPTETMHSLKLSHNEIQWSIKVQGEIDFWPDISDSYDIVVLPHPFEIGARA